MERNIAYVALFTALIAALGQMPQIMLVTGVPITLQSLGVMLAGSVLGAKRGALAVVLLLGLAAIGLPLLAGGTGGLGVFAGPTAGFLMGFPIAAFVTGWIVEKWRAPIGYAAFAGSVLGAIIVLYGFGVFGMAAVLHVSPLVALGYCTPFLAGDLLKAVVCAAITRQLAQLRPASLLSRL